MNVLKKISCIFIKIFKRYSACILHRFCKSNIPNIILFGVLLNWLKQIVGVNPMSQIWPYFYTDVFKINLNTLTFTSSAKWHRGVRFKWGDVQNLIFTWPISPNWSKFNAERFQYNLYLTTSLWLMVSTRIFFYYTSKRSLMQKIFVFKLLRKGLSVNLYASIYFLSILVLYRGYFCPV